MQILQVIYTSEKGFKSFNDEILMLLIPAPLVSPYRCKDSLILHKNTPETSKIIELIPPLHATGTHICFLFCFHSGGHLGQAVQKNSNSFRAEEEKISMAVNQYFKTQGLASQMH